MTTQETANKLVELCRKGQFQEATDTLYADNIVSVEPEHAPGQSRIEGKEAKNFKDQYFSDMIAEYHGLEASEPLVADDHFTIRMVMDATFKDGGRQKMEEVCVYRVNKDGLIDYEEFFYSPSQG